MPANKASQSKLWEGWCVASFQNEENLVFKHKPSFLHVDFPFPPIAQLHWALSLPNFFLEIETESLQLLNLPLPSITTQKEWAVFP